MGDPWMERDRLQDAYDSIKRAMEDACARLTRERDEARDEAREIAETQIATVAECTRLRASLAVMRERAPRVLECDGCESLAPVVVRFAEAMLHKLHRNHAKGDRDGWLTCNPDWLVERLREEVDELAREVHLGNGADVRKEAADVANFALMIADVCGGLDDVAVSAASAEDGGAK